MSNFKERHPMTKERHPMTIVVMMSLSMNSSVVLNSNRVIILCFLLLYIESAVLLVCIG